MKVTEKLARYILQLQDYQEFGYTDEDNEVRRQLEKAIPVLRREREAEEYHSWIIRKAHEDPRYLATKRDIDNHVRIPGTERDSEWQHNFERLFKIHNTTLPRIIEELLTREDLKQEFFNNVLPKST